MPTRAPTYGRRLEDFEVGATYAHPWEVTLDQGMVALWNASFLDATPTYASERAARAVGLRARPVPPMLLLNFGLGLSVHDVSEQAIAHLAYIDVRFPEACYAGDTIRATSRVLSATRSRSAADRGVVHVRTHVVADDGRRLVCALERKVLVRASEIAVGWPAPITRGPFFPADPVAPAGLSGEIVSMLTNEGEVPPGLQPERGSGGDGPRFAVFADDLAPGDVFAHAAGRTVSEAEHMQLTWLCKNTHPLHTDERYAHAAGLAGTRVVCGGLVLAWTAALASRDTTCNVIWDMGLDEGSHPNPVVAGDTLYAATQVVAVEPFGDGAAAARVTLRLIGTKNVGTAELLARGAPLFERGSPRDAVPEKVVLVDRRVLMRKRPA